MLNLMLFACLSCRLVQGRGTKAEQDGIKCDGAKFG